MLFKTKNLVLYSVAVVTILLLLGAFLGSMKAQIFHSARSFALFTFSNINPSNERHQSLTAEALRFGHNFPRSVYYVWCQPKKRYFEFRNYLSVMSVVQSLKPDSIIFFYSEYPAIDADEYNTWLKDILFNIPFFQTRKAPVQACLPNGKVKQTFLDEFLNERHGMYVDENTIITSNDSSRLSEFCSFRRDSATEPSMLCSSASPVGVRQLVECPLGSELANRTEIPLCLVIDRSIFPKNIWTKNNILSRASRKIFYGSEDILQPKPSYTELAPNIAHMVWMGGGKMDFLFYLGVLSLLYVVEVDKVFVYGDRPPAGYYWSLFENDTRVEHIPHEPVSMIYGKEIKSYPHMSDILRVEFMIKQGGIYLDTDAVFVKPLDKRIRAYDAVATYDWADCSHPFPEFINFGVAVGKKGAKFWHLFQETMRNFRDDIYIFNGLQRPYKVMERHPDLIFIEPHLQLQCINHECHPTWIEDFHNPKNHHLNPSVKIDWKTDVFAYHWTAPTPKEFFSFQALMKGNGVFAEIGKFILSKSGMMDYFLRHSSNDSANPI